MEDISERTEEKKDFGDIIYRNFGPSEGGSKLMRVLEFMIYFVGLLGTALTLPVAYRIWTTQNATGEVMTSWLALTLFTPFWILYGILHKKKSLAMTYVVWLLVNAVVVIGIWIYG